MTGRVETLPDPAALAARVAEEFVARLREAQADRATPHVVLTGGTIAAEVYREIGRIGADSGVDWGRVVLWWGDERFVPAGDPDRNALAALSGFVEALGIPEAHVHEMPSASEAPDVVAAAAAYADELRWHGPREFELVLLGVGPDGHVASLFPGHRATETSDRVAVGITDSPKPPPARVSLTLPALNGSRAVWFVASGFEKADAVSSGYADAAGRPDRAGSPFAGARVSTPSLPDQRIPAARVRGRVETVWFLDRAAASRM